MTKSFNQFTCNMRLNQFRSRMQNKSKMLKGQFFSYDAVVAGILFILLLTLLYNYWNSLRATISVRMDDATRIALDVSDMLLTPGSPIDWNSTNYNQLGLAAQYNSIEINESKLSELQKIEYTTLKQKLGVGPYELFIELNDTKIGLPSSGSVSSITIKRPVIYQNSLQNLSVTIWSSR